VIDSMKAQGVHTVFHYVPLHSAPAGRKLGRAHGHLQHTDRLSERLLRLPLWVGLEDHQQRVLAALGTALAQHPARR